MRRSGTTSAHAENTFAAKLLNAQKWNYLRARGEYIILKRIHIDRAELPPRTRRILDKLLAAPPKGGTTSAHAENTWGEVGCQPLIGNYLRARGEYVSSRSLILFSRELPPRTRRILAARPVCAVNHRTTSAHAENTRGRAWGPRYPRNYLRARGEYINNSPPNRIRSELPPRTRRIHQPYAGEFDSLGTTSAHAENTP